MNQLVGNPRRNLTPERWPARTQSTRFGHPIQAATKQRERGRKGDGGDFRDNVLERENVFPIISSVPLAPLPAPAGIASSRRRGYLRGCWEGKGDRSNLPGRAAGCFAQIGPVPFFPCWSRIKTAKGLIMANVKVLPIQQFGRQFVPPEYSAAEPGRILSPQRATGQASRHGATCRAHEIETLVKNANTCDDWDLFLVADPFDPQLIKNCEFSGLVRIARLEPVMLEHHDLQMPAGITNSTVISCDIGENAAIHNVRYLAHYIVGDNVMLLNISEMHTTNHAKFGNCIVKDGEPEDVRVWLDLVNETGTRAVMAFDGMIAADAYLWAKYRDDDALQRKLGEITQRQFDSRRGFYGTVGAGCVIKNCQILKDVKIGPACYIKGANKLKNLTINSSEDEPTQIGEGVELINGIVGFGCHVFYGCKAVRFVMGNNSNLKYGARLIHSYLGDNSTVSCCELLNNLIFPAHEQHHNNSFLVASLVLGQSNLAAGATIGSNHNSRANDGEILAGRGFWPGLCTTLKHSCRFASFTLLVKGDYPAELDIPLPFSLLNDDRANDRLLVIPAYWWRYNMYALARNTWKFTTRDKRKTKTQHIEFDCLAPDTVEEIFVALRLLEVWAGKAQASGRGQIAGSASSETESGRRSADRCSTGPANASPDLEIFGENMEASRSPRGDPEGPAGIRRLPRNAALLCGQESAGLHASQSEGHVPDDVPRAGGAARAELGEPRRPARARAGGRSGCWTTSSADD